MLGMQANQLGPFSNGEETSFARVRGKTLVKGEIHSAMIETTRLHQEIRVHRLALTRVTPEGMMQPVENITPHYLTSYLRRAETVYQ